MPHLSITEPSRFTPQQLFDLVADVPSYPQFLPWCRAARITKRISEQEFLAELVIHFKLYTEKYTSHVTLTEATADNPEYRVLAEMVEGPFHHLSNLWILRPSAQGGTDIELDLDFRFQSAVLEKLIGGLFEKASEKMVGAFRQRARDLYGT